jgi:hypothetical protein
MKMIVFADGDYVVITQTVTRKGEEIEVPCRLVQYTPPTERPDGKMTFHRLGKNAFFQVTVQHIRNKGIYKVKYNPSKAAEDHSKPLRVTNPDTLVKENWWDKIPTKLVKGTSTDWMPLDTDHLQKQFGANVAAFVMDLIAEAEDEARSKKKKAA